MHQLKPQEHHQKQPKRVPRVLEWYCRYPQ
jgi:hypothetical protein